MPNPKTRLDDAAHLYLGVPTSKTIIALRTKYRSYRHGREVDRGKAADHARVIAKWRRQEIRREKKAGEWKKPEWSSTPAVSVHSKYDSADDKHNAYLSELRRGVALPSRKGRHAEGYRRPSRGASRQHLPQHPVSSHFYSGGTVLPSTGTLRKTEPGARASKSSKAGRERARYVYGCSVSDAVGSHVTPHTLHASKSHFSSDAKHRSTLVGPRAAVTYRRCPRRRVPPAPRRAARFTVMGVLFRAKGRTTRGATSVEAARAAGYDGTKRRWFRV